MDTYVDERDYKLLEADRYTFFVLKRIMGGECKLLLSDHERLILCFTGHPFPVWIWTSDDASGEEMERAYQLAKENKLLAGEHRFNIKYSLAEYFIRRAAEDGSVLKIITNMFAYDCLDPVRPDTEADGGIYCCEMKDLEELVDFLDNFHKELRIDQKDISGYREDAEAFIRTGNMYLWKDEQGHNVASCKYAPDGDMASINLVFTRPEFRRRHYAENLVYQVTMKVKEEGYVPMLYTDADYVASNACYEKIGYVLRGKALHDRLMVFGEDPIKCPDSLQDSITSLTIRQLTYKALNQEDQMGNADEHSKIILKAAAEDDIPNIWKMQVRAFSDLLDKYQDYDISPASEDLEKVMARFRQPWTTYYFIVAEDETVGAIRVVDKKDGSRKRISPIWIMQEYRNKGYAQAAILAAEKIHGSGNWCLDTILQEKGNLHLYEKMGYHRTGKTEKINERMDIVFYEKD